ncbi:MAG: zinc-dependent metalloprotease [Hyphomicrobium sp.]|uniref:M12 family metallo-peptidase n=1 Tax=Hyphomicrobium sp. TaxID=82 RepID=UPI0013251071|nr:M12 family metallo-peptidase [Hyphomicrobium sp.]KAB2940180.1 MAG: hypothetical protein F9K20_14100 [Hyphomicrobium sp.]MBZ0210470.1 zinc-dependent metalloprotease [Hyphomicrobium sp.]
MPAVSNKRALRAALFAAALIGVPLAFAVDGMRSHEMHGYILSHLPAPGSAAYEAVKRAAGAPSGEPLEMTDAEMWLVPSERVDALKAAAASHGIEVMALDDASSRALMPMDPTSPMTEKQSAMMHDAMSSPAAMGISMMQLPDPKVMEYELTKGMRAPSAAQPAPELTIALDATTMIKARRTHIEKTPEGYVWHGTVVGTDDPVTLLWWPSGRLSGQITHRGHHYVVKNLGDNLHGVVEMSPRKLPPEHAPMGKPLMDKMHMREDPLVTKGDAGMLRKPPAGKTERPQEPIRNLQDAAPKARAKDTEVALMVPPAPSTQQGRQPVTIDLIVAYTPQAAKHYTDIKRDLIEVAVEEANQSFRNSGIDNVRLRLAHAYETDYAETGSHFEHVFRFADKGDGYMEEVHALRDQHKADIAALIVHDPNGCGLSAAVAPPADRAFTVVHHECAALSYSLAHEIGHIIGARHDLALDDGKQPFPFGHGFVSGKDWRTMMSYEESCDGCPRLAVWSNPRIKVRGVAAGDAMADNARAILEGAARVAAFR